MAVDTIKEKKISDIKNSEEFKKFTKEIGDINKNSIKEVFFGYLINIKYKFINDNEIEIVDFLYNKMSDTYDTIDNDYFNIELLDNIIKRRLPNISYILSNNVKNKLNT